MRPFRLQQKLNHLCAASRRPLRCPRKQEIFLAVILLMCYWQVNMLVPRQEESIVGDFSSLYSVPKCAKAVYVTLIYTSQHDKNIDIPDTLCRKGFLLRDDTVIMAASCTQEELYFPEVVILSTGEHRSVLQTQKVPSHGVYLLTINMPPQQHFHGGWPRHRMFLGGSSDANVLHFRDKNEESKHGSVVICMFCNDHKPILFFESKAGFLPLFRHQFKDTPTQTSTSLK